MLKHQLIFHIGQAFLTFLYTSRYTACGTASRYHLLDTTKDESLLWKSFFLFSFFFVFNWLVNCVGTDLQYIPIRFLWVKSFMYLHGNFTGRSHIILKPLRITSCPFLPHGRGKNGQFLVIQIVTISKTIRRHSQLSQVGACRLITKGISFYFPNCF